MPFLLRILAEGRRPKRPQRQRDAPAERLVPQVHPDEVTPLAAEVLKRVPPMHERQVVDEVHVAGLQRDLDAVLLRDGVDEVERFPLPLRDLGHAAGPGVGLGAQQGSPGVVKDHFGVVVEKNGALVEIRPGDLRTMVSLVCTVASRGVLTRQKANLVERGFV